MKKEIIKSIYENKQVVLVKGPSTGRYFVIQMDNDECEHEDANGREFMQLNENEFEKLVVNYLHEKFKRNAMAEISEDDTMSIGAVNVGDGIEYQFDIKSNLIDKYISAKEIEKQINDIESADIPI